MRFFPGAGTLAGGNISWNAAGSATYKGSIESNDSGNTIVIDALDRSFKMKDASGVKGSWKFYEDTSEISIFGVIENPPYIGEINDPNTMRFGKTGLSIGGTTHLEGFRVGPSSLILERGNHRLIVRPEVSSLFVIMSRLPTSDTNLQLGQLWRDSSGYLRVK